MSLVAPSVSGWSGFWSMNGDGVAYAMSQAQSRAGSAYRISKFMKRGENRDVIGALAALIGAAAGGTATNTYTRRKAPGATNTTVPDVTGFGAFGGNIGMETVTAINRATTAADVTELKKWFDNTLLESGITYPTVAGVTQGGMQGVGGTTQF